MEPHNQKTKHGAISDVLGTLVKDELLLKEATCGKSEESILLITMCKMYNFQNFSSDYLVTHIF